MKGHPFVVDTFELSHQAFPVSDYQTHYDWAKLQDSKCSNNNKSLLSTLNNKRV